MSSVTRISAATRTDDPRRLASLLQWTGWLPLAGLAVAYPLAAPVSDPVRYLPLLASAVVFGMPHGALDYVALPRALDGGVTRRGLGIVGVLYAVLGVGYLALWWLVPIVAATVFILLTWFHWGQGELYVLRDVFGASYVDRTQQVLTTGVRGGLPMLVPLIAFPDRYSAVLETFVAPFGGAVGTWPLFEPNARVALAAAFGMLTIATLVRGRRRSGSSRAWRLDATEVVVLWVVFLLVEPILAIGVYFCLWHSVRHLARVGWLDGRVRTAVEDGQWWRAIGRVGLEAAPLSIAALALIGGLFTLVPTGSSIGGAVGLYLVGIAVLTLPHTVVVTWIDRKQGFWL
ncbi:beta-carotene 15,15'-dioxygenase [Halorhabdus sp. CBA1104]|uniref:Brp/Blh family beta-carotene 15,15'-dioxygenase n=1 Tax=unclassified Halorhabdus TaxID=2621901 RepID=UPI0012B1B8DB|nr:MULTISPECIES: Brp/Blh family beta-carotene 15,15'-dioxygenase [unclassified Halorhabdus]QGN05891.1 beta-carotene 15,15'-dioxygenase [Halorhabdus sp. CBA1104]